MDRTPHLRSIGPGPTVGQLLRGIARACVAGVLAGIAAVAFVFIIGAIL